MSPQDRFDFGCVNRCRQVHGSKDLREWSLLRARLAVLVLSRSETTKDQAMRLGHNFDAAPDLESGQIHGYLNAMLGLQDTAG